MRHKYKVSPVPVIDGGYGWLGYWEWSVQHNVFTVPNTPRFQLSKRFLDERRPVLLCGGKALAVSHQDLKLGHVTTHLNGHEPSAAAASSKAAKVM